MRRFRLRYFGIGTEYCQSVHIHGFTVSVAVSEVRAVGGWHVLPLLVWSNDCGDYRKGRLFACRLAMGVVPALACYAFAFRISPPVASIRESFRATVREVRRSGFL